MAAIAVHRLAERGLVDYDAPVARYWPEFAAAGKDAVTVRHLLTHSAGLPRLREPLPPGGLYEWETVVAALAAEAPHWEPGTAHGYHTFSFGLSDQPKPGYQVTPRSLEVQRRLRPAVLEALQQHGYVEDEKKAI
jgi:hypothetical protein